jgi:hypothetical protein
LRLGWGVSWIFLLSSSLFLRAPAPASSPPSDLPLPRTKHTSHLKKRRSHTHKQLSTPGPTHSSSRRAPARRPPAAARALFGGGKEVRKWGETAKRMWTSVLCDDLAIRRCAARPVHCCDGAAGAGTHARAWPTHKTSTRPVHLTHFSLHTRLTTPPLSPPSPHSFHRAAAATRWPTSAA